MYILIGPTLGTKPPPNELGSVRVVGREGELGSAQLQPNIELGSALLQSSAAAPATSSGLGGAGSQPVTLPKRDTERVRELVAPASTPT